MLLEYFYLARIYFRCISFVNIEALDFFTRNSIIEVLFFTAVVKAIK